tara:strand:- start:157 stop:402 length:246 start_codon:yes stop_codon:yes gene_type:complete
MRRVSRTDYSGDRIAKLEKEMKGIQDDIKGIKGDLGGMGRQLSTIEYNVRVGQKGLNMDLDGMARMHNALTSRVEALEDKK